MGYIQVWMDDDDDDEANTLLYNALADVPPNSLGGLALGGKSTSHFLEAISGSRIRSLRIDSCDWTGFHSLMQPSWVSATPCGLRSPDS
jgi:hypothetical protein